MNEIKESLRNIEQTYKIFQQQQFTFIAALEHTRENAHDKIKPVSSIGQVRIGQEPASLGVRTGQAGGFGLSPHPSPAMVMDSAIKSPLCLQLPAVALYESFFKVSGVNHSSTVNGKGNCWAAEVTEDKNGASVPSTKDMGNMVTVVLAQDSLVNAVTSCLNSVAA
uniref:Uncharacterized protein n=1 Tax=Sphaerodactylus townsendi TaxID=933632 RepID=A0ACB8F078_9SAUR